MNFSPKFSNKILPVLGLLVFFNLFVILALPPQALAQTPPAATDQSRCAKFKKQFELPLNGTTTNISSDAPFYCSATDLLTTAITYSLAMAGGVAILFLIVGGFWYLSSAGNEELAEKGKKTLVNALLGLVVIIMSAAIVRIVASTLSLGK